MVYDVAHAVKIPVVGLGGISTAKDAIEFLMCGATAIEIGTANFVDPAVTKKVKMESMTGSTSMVVLRYMKSLAPSSNRMLAKLVPSGNQNFLTYNITFYKKDNVIGY